MVGLQRTLHTGCDAEIISSNPQSVHRRESGGTLFHGVWSQDQSVLNINILEMKAILLALVQCQQNVSNSKVMIATDKSSR